MFLKMHMNCNIDCNKDCKHCQFNEITVYTNEVPKSKYGARSVTVRARLNTIPIIEELVEYDTWVGRWCFPEGYSSDTSIINWDYEIGLFKY